MAAGVSVGVSTVAVAEVDRLPTVASPAIKMTAPNRCISNANEYYGVGKARAPTEQISEKF